MRRFMIKMGSVFMLLATVLVLQGMVFGSLHLLVGLLLLPSCGIITLALFSAGTRKVRRRARRPMYSGAAPHTAPQPQLRLAHGGKKPGGPRAA